MDFIGIVDCIFHNKKKYWEITDEDKEKNFFIINQKFSRKFPKIGQFLNDKTLDKPTSLDKWFFHFEDNIVSLNGIGAKKVIKAKKRKSMVMN